MSVTRQIMPQNKAQTMRFKYTSNVLICGTERLCNYQRQLYGFYEGGNGEITKESNSHDLRYCYGAW